MKKKYIRFIALHIPLIFLLFFAFLSLRYDQRFELSLHEGKEIDVQPEFIRNGFPLMQKTNLQLLRFDHVPGSDEEKKQSYTSFLLVNGKPISLSVNKPLRLERFQLYQMDWRIFARSVVFSLPDTVDEITLETLSKRGLILHDGSKLFVAPEKVLTDGMLYFWQQIDESKKELSKGYFTSIEAKGKVLLPLVGNDSFLLHLFEEDYGYTTILQVTWKPFQLPLFISALVFLFTQFYVYVPMAVRSVKREES